MPTNADHRTIADNVMRRRSNCRRRTKSTVVTVTVLWYCFLEIIGEEELDRYT